VHRDDGVLPGKGMATHRPRDHEILHHVTVLEFVLNRVCMVWASLLEESLEVVCGQPRLVLPTANDNHDAYHTEAARFLAIATVVIGHG
jgi:hypothetical protein